MKTLFALFTIAALSVVNTESMIAHTPDVIVIHYVADELPGGAYLTIAGKFGGEITTSEVTKNTTLEIQGCAAGAKIFQFVLVIDKEGKSQKMKGESSDLTKEMLKALRELSKGDEFTFKDVKAHLNSTDDVDVWAKKFVIS